VPDQVSGAAPRGSRRARSFGAAADLYDAVRPSYPPEAARWLLGERPCRVADLGAGTGIFTRVLVSLGHDVVAVEPDDEMRRKLGERAPAIQGLAGSAEAIPLADASLDGVTAAQAHHWFDEPAAFAEIARVLRPGGVYGVLSNRRDESVEWVRELTRVARLSEGSQSGHDDRGFGPGFTPPEPAEFRHSTTLDLETLVGLVQSRSNYLVASTAERRRIEAAVRELGAGLPEQFQLPYVTLVLRRRRLPSAESRSPLHR
jgi:SAM-dependent methyltransferase